MKPTRTVSRRLTDMGESVRRWRLMQSLKAEELAERAGISRSTLQKIERGDAGVSIGAVMSVMQALGQIDHVVGPFDPLTTDVVRLCSPEPWQSGVRGWAIPSPRSWMGGLPRPSPGRGGSLSLRCGPQPRSNTLTISFRLGVRSPSIPHCHFRLHG